MPWLVFIVKPMSIPQRIKVGKMMEKILAIRMPNGVRRENKKPKTKMVKK